MRVINMDTPYFDFLRLTAGDGGGLSWAVKSLNPTLKSSPGSLSFLTGTASADRPELGDILKREKKQVSHKIGLVLAGNFGIVFHTQQRFLHNKHLLQNVCVYF